MVCLSAGRACKHEADAEGDEKLLHRDTSTSKRSTNRPARVEPSRYNEAEPARRKRARGADSAHPGGSTAKQSPTPDRSRTSTTYPPRSSVFVLRPSTSR